MIAEVVPSAPLEAVIETAQTRSPHPPGESKSLPPAGGANRSQFDSLQILRGIAAILVVLFHVTIQIKIRYPYTFLDGMFLRGWCGVDLFFVLSGFIISHIHQRDLGHPSALGPYAVKRLIRIYPVYWLVLTGLAVVAFLIPGIGSAQEREIANLVRSYLLIPSRGLPLLGVAWSLCHEVFFYGVFGVLILIGGRPAWILFGSWLAASGLFGYLNPAFDWPNSPVVHQMPFPQFLAAFLCNPLNLEFGFGVLLARFIPRINAPGTLLGIGLVLAATFLLVPEVFTSVLPPFLARAAVLGVAGACIVGFGIIMDRRAAVPAATRSGLRASWNHLSAFLKLMGDASYSIYLVHLPLMVGILILLKRRFAVPIGLLPWIGAALAAASLICGLLVNRIIEEPLLNWCRRTFLPARRAIAPGGPPGR